MPVESFILFAFFFNLIKSLFVVDLLKKKKLLSIVSGAMSMVLHDILNGIWL